MRLTLIALLALGACTGQGGENAAAALNTAEPANAAAIGDEASPAPLPPAATASPSETAAPGNAASPPQAAPAGDEGAQGAAKVVETYYALLEAGKYGQAHALWEPQALGTPRAAFAASFARYREYHGEVGAPGRVDAGAGQRYVTVPVRVHGRLEDGRAFETRGSVTLHRAADIDGATPEQKRWRIRETDIEPLSTGGAAPSPSPTADNRSRTVFRCIDGSRMAATFDPDNARVTIVRAGRTLVLRQQPSGSGIRYGDGRVTFSGKGDNMLLEAPGQPPLPCAPIRR